MVAISCSGALTAVVGVHRPILWGSVEWSGGEHGPLNSYRKENEHGRIVGMLIFEGLSCYRVATQGKLRPRIQLFPGVR